MMESEHSEATAQDFRALLEWFEKKNKENDRMRRLAEWLRAADILNFLS